MPFEAHFDGIAEPPERLKCYGMPKLFFDIDEFLEKDAKRGEPKTYVRGVFDPKTLRALERFIRSVMSTGDRVEINVAPLKSLD